MRIRDRNLLLITAVLVRILLSINRARIKSRYLSSLFSSKDNHTREIDDGRRGRFCDL